MRVDVGATRTRKGRERHPATFGRSHGERRGGRNGKEDLDAAHGGLLDHLVGGAGAHDERAVPPALARAKAEELVERHVAANVLGAARGRAVGSDPDGGMGAARERADALEALQLRDGIAVEPHVEGLRGGQIGHGAKRIAEALDAADAATRAPEHGAAAGLEVVEGFGADGDPHLAARAAGFNHLDVVDVRDGLDDAFGEAEAGAELLEHDGRGHHDSVGDAVVDERDGHLFGDHVLGLEAHEVLEDGHGRDRAGEIVRKTGHVASPQNAGIRPERERMPGLSSRGPGHQRPWSWPA